MAKKKMDDILHPKDNPVLIGHKAIEDNFVRAWINRDRDGIHPVWILSGVKGIGKATLVYRIARYVFKTMHSGDGLFGDDTPTNMDMEIEDPIFQRMVVGGLGDFFVLSEERDDGTIQSISVDEVRDMIEKFQLSAMEDSWRVCVIDSVDSLNNAAANALLKVLEEPPAKVLFLMTAHSLSDVLPTIRSRSSVQKMYPLDASAMRALMFDFMPDVTIDQQEILIKLSAGSFGKALRLYQLGGVDFFQSLMRLVGANEVSINEQMTLVKQMAKVDGAIDVVTEILLDVIHHYAMISPQSQQSKLLADMYADCIKEMRALDKLYLDAESVLIKMLTGVRSCLLIPTVI